MMLGDTDTGESCWRENWGYLGFPGVSEAKNPSANAGDVGSIPTWGSSPGKGSGNPLQYSCLGNPMDRLSLAGYSPWGCRE